MRIKTDAKIKFILESFGHKLHWDERNHHYFGQLVLKPFNLFLKELENCQYILSNIFCRPQNVLTLGYYSNTDAHGFISTPLCGDGEIIAQITNVSGDGWAGIVMREGTGPSDRMIQLSIGGVMLTKREIRQSPDNVAFAHIQIIGSGSLLADLPEPDEAFKDFKFQPTIDVYPNPTSGKSYVDLSAYLGEKVNIQVYHNAGQFLKTIEIDEVQLATERIDLSPYQRGMYMIKVEAEGFNSVTNKLTKID